MLTWSGVLVGDPGLECFDSWMPRKLWAWTMQKNRCSGTDCQFSGFAFCRSIPEVTTTAIAACFSERPGGPQWGEIAGGHPLHACCHCCQNPCWILPQSKILWSGLVEFWHVEADTNALGSLRTCLFSLSISSVRWQFVAAVNHVLALLSQA